MENQHRKISGYRELNQEEIDAMNAVKKMETDVGELFQKISDIKGIDSVQLHLAKANLQQGFMWLVKSIGKSVDPFVKVVTTKV